jgi:hypothetical protein
LQKVANTRHFVTIWSWQAGGSVPMSVLLQEQIIHPTYLRLLCLDVRRRGVSLADALGGTGIPARDAECYRVGSDPWAVCTRVQDCGEQGAIARLVELYRAGAQNADVYHAVYTIAMWGVAPIWRLWGR